MFGIDVVESVLSGSHYERSLDGICLLGECISRLQWVEFLRNDVSKYINKLKIIEELKRAISEKKKADILKFLQNFKVSSSKLLKEFELISAKIFSRPNQRKLNPANIFLDKSAKPRKLMPSKMNHFKVLHWLQRIYRFILSFGILFDIYVQIGTFYKCLRYLTIINFHVFSFREKIFRLVLAVCVFAISIDFPSFSLI